MLFWVAEIKTTDISPAEFMERNREPIPFVIIDVRERIEFQTFNIGGQNIPLGILLKDTEELEELKNKELIVICQHGLRSETARRFLLMNGFKNVRNLHGGILALRKLNY
jgi:rhodanese-related sulfurtransferase